MPEIKPPFCELLAQPLVAPKPWTRDDPPVSIAQDRRCHPFPTCHATPFAALSLELVLLRAAHPVQAIARCPCCVGKRWENAGNSQTLQAYVRTGSRAHSRAGRYCSNGSVIAHLRHVLPLALVRTKTRLAHRRGFNVNKFRQSQSGWGLPRLHGRRRITQTAVGSVPSHTST